MFKTDRITTKDSLVLTTDCAIRWLYTALVLSGWGRCGTDFHGDIRVQSVLGYGYDLSVQECHTA
jgi:hypothetical protein